MDLGTAIQFGVGEAAGAVQQNAYAEIESQIQQNRAAALDQIQSDIAVNQANTQRTQKVAAIDQQAQQYANDRAATRPGLINSDMAPNQTEPASANPNDLIAADQGDTSQMKPTDLSPDLQAKYAAATPNVTDQDTIRASVKAGYTDPIELVKMLQQDRMLNYQNAQLGIKEQHEQSYEAHQDAYQQHQDDWLKVMMGKLGENGAGAQPAELKIANALIADAKSQGKTLSLADAVQMTHKMADDGNSFAMQFLKVASDNGMIGPKKQFSSVDDALEAGRKAYVNPRAALTGSKQPPVTADGSVTAPARPPLSSFAK